MLLFGFCLHSLVAPSALVVHPATGPPMGPLVQHMRLSRSKARIVASVRGQTHSASHLTGQYSDLYKQEQRRIFFFFFSEASRTTGTGNCATSERESKVKNGGK